MEKENKWFILYAALIWLGLLLFGLSSCSVPFRHQYSCPLDTSKKGTLHQKLQKPPSKIKLSKINCQ